MASTQQIETIINQAIALFEEREELSLLEQAIPELTEEGYEDWDFSHVATEIIDTFRHAVTDASDGESYDVDALRSRMEEIEALPHDWWEKNHPMYAYLDEFIAEKRELSRLFDEFEEVIREELYYWLYPSSELGEYVLALVCERSNIEVDRLDPALRASIDLNKLIDRYKADGGTLHTVEFAGSTWFFGH